MHHQVDASCTKTSHQQSQLLRTLRLRLHFRLQRQGLASRSQRRALHDCQHQGRFWAQNWPHWWCHDCHQCRRNVLSAWFSLKGDEEVIGGFDLIYKNKEISIGSATSYTTMLGCKNNRVDNLKKLARATAFRLAKEFQEKNRVVDSNKKIENKFTIKTSTKIEKGRFPQKASIVDSRKSKSSVNVDV